MKKTKSAFKALEVVILPDGSYVFQLKPEYSATSKNMHQNQSCQMQH